MGVLPEVGEGSWAFLLECFFLLKALFSLYELVNSKDHIALVSK